MKKIMTLAAFAAVAVGAQAATITWGIGADIYLVEKGADYGTAKVAYESSLTPESGSYLALVYVGQNQDSFSISDITQDSVVASAAYGIDTDGASYADYDPYSTITTVSATTYGDGASFAVVWFDAGAGAFDYVYSIDNGSALNSAITFADMTRGSDSIMPAETTNGYGGVLTVTSSTPVIPEPGIACMALLGIGMMIKRRRA